MKAKYLEYGGKLAIVCILCMLGVAGAYVGAKKTIEEGKRKAFVNAISEVLGLPADAEAPEALNPEAKDAEKVFFAEVDGQKRYAAQGVHKGYSGDVVVAVGAYREEGVLRVYRVRVIQQTETPGLGTRIALQTTDLHLWSAIAGAEGKTGWYFLSRYDDKAMENLRLTADVAEADEKVLQITGVTISSNACTAAVRKALARIRENVD